MLKKLLILVLGVIAITLLITTVALAFTPQDIYNDYSHNGKLTQHYSDAELRAYLNDATLHQYGKPTIIGRLDDLVNDLLTRSEFPFTGFQLLIAGIVAVALVGGGITLRRLSRPQKS
jgi:hypothetical protein